MTDAELWADMKKPSRRRFHQLTPYQRHCLAIVYRGLRAERFGQQERPMNEHHIRAKVFLAAAERLEGVAATQTGAVRSAYREAADILG